tara:strand:- start:5241 stop:5984 length:744 start_codon:yes stop_codon:yes gene_type:complete
MGVKNIFKALMLCALMIFTIYSSYTDTIQRLTVESVLSKKTQIVKPHLFKSINSAVKVISSTGYYEKEGLTAASTGTYFTHQDHNYILTTAHSLVGPCETTIVISDAYMFQCLNVIVFNDDKDYAIFEVEQVFNRIPLTINQFLYDEKQTKMNITVHENIFYTGYPQGIGPLTFNGNIVSHKQQNGIFYANSYAWSGSSGSGVFNDNGSLIGIITAVSVANTEHGVDVMEDLIIITPLNILDFIGAL